MLAQAPAPARPAPAPAAATREPSLAELQAAVIRLRAQVLEGDLELRSVTARLAALERGRVPAADQVETIDCHALFVANLRTTHALAAEVERLAAELAALRPPGPPAAPGPRP